MAKTATCPKCQGAKFIQAFRHIEAGVCFMCNGQGVVEYRGHWNQPSDEQKQKSAEETARKRAWLLNATPEAIESLSWKQIHSARSFVVACLVNGDEALKRVQPLVNRVFEKHVEKFDQKV